MVRLFNDLRMDIHQAIKIHNDNTNTTTMMKNPMFHNNSKHIDIHHHFMRDLVQDGFIEFKFYKSEDNL